MGTVFRVVLLNNISMNQEARKMPRELNESPRVYYKKKGEFNPLPDPWKGSFRDTMVWTCCTCDGSNKLKKYIFSHH